MLGSGRTVAASLLLLLPVGCPPPSSFEPCALTGCEEPSSSGANAGSSTASTGSSGDLSVTTGSGEASTTDFGDTSTSSGEPEPIVPPTIVSAVWTPNPLTEPGAARLEVVTDDADDVVAWLGGQPFPLAPVEEGSSVFAGEFAVFSELSDGTYTADLVPVRGQVEGQPLSVDLIVDLPLMGTEALWDANPGLGVGLAGTILPGPDGDLFEFGTRDPGGVPNCALRRRNADGKSGPNDVIGVQPGKLCTATDAAIDIDGTLLLLSEVTDNGETLWQLDRHDPWNHTLVTEMWGPPGMKGNAVAVGPAGQIAVCGAMPSGPDTTDMAIRTENPKGSATFDLKYDEDLQLEFKEVANDCVFIGDKLVLAGDAKGSHPPDMSIFTRHTTVEVDLQTKQAKWNIAKAYPGLLVNSSAQAITADSSGGWITAGHVCEENCFPQVELRQFSPGGVQMTSYRTTAKTTPATGITWHPAGYVVVTAGEIVSGNWSKMWAQAWIPGHPKELWTYSQSYTEGIHMALDVAVGQSGWVHLVGIAELEKGLLVPTFVTLFP